jgi:predicted DNA-binding protein (MmcQ/YjbR family)
LVDPAQLRAACLGQRGAYEDFPFGEAVSVFKVADRMFALSALHEDPLQVSLKCEPELGVNLRRSYPAIAEGYHLNKRHWITVTIDGSLSEEVLTELIEDSYELVVDLLPKARRP